jgi:hypothetical protein
MSDSTTSSPQAEGGTLGVAGAGSTSGVAATAGGAVASSGGEESKTEGRADIPQNYAFGKRPT